MIEIAEPTDGDPRKSGLHRRELFAAGLTVAVAAAGGNVLAKEPVTRDAALAPVTAETDLPGEAMLTLNAAEQAFLIAAVDILIPADALSPSASECGVVTFIDRQLGGAWGAGARLYRSGPFLKGKPEHGYQLPLTPREYFGAGIVEVNDWARLIHGAPLEGLAPSAAEDVLRKLEAGQAELQGLSGKDFFEALLAITMEGFFADPIYGGNRHKAGWRMIGYPGLPATYARAIEEYRGKPYRVSPKSIEDFL